MYIRLDHRQSPGASSVRGSNDNITTMGPKQNGTHFADDIFIIFIKSSLKTVPNGVMDSKSGGSAGYCCNHCCIVRS